MKNDLAGVRVGHATNDQYHTGCTVFLCPPDTYGSVDARGPAPGSREFALLGPDKPEGKAVNAIVLTGGSAFGLATADGVMRYHHERKIGYITPVVPVPIVPAAVIFDMGFNMAQFFPGPEMGYEACEAAEASDEIAVGNVGVGTGALVGTWAGFMGMMKGGFGLARATHGDVEVAAAAVVNAVGDVVAADGSVIAGAGNPEGGWMADLHPYRYVDLENAPDWGTNTTLVVAITNAIVSHSDLARLPHRAHDGMAIAIRPTHTRHDGDVAFALSTGKVAADSVLVGNMVAESVAGAIRNAVLSAHSFMGVPGAGGDKPE